MAFTTWQTLGMEFQTRRGLGMSESLVGTALHTWRKLGSEFHSCTANMMGATTGHRIVITPFTKIATTNLRTDPIVSPSCWRFLRDTMIPGVIVRKNNTHTHKQIPGRLNFLSLKSTIYSKIRNRNDQRWAKQWSSKACFRWEACAETELVIPTLLASYFSKWKPIVSRHVYSSLAR